MSELGDMPDVTVDDTQPPRAAGGIDASPTALDLSTPRDEAPLPADQPKAAQTPDTAIPDGVTSERRMEQQREALGDD
ncbi:hypothetical protein KLP28_00635 [Nocardioidaceae bacterium]|nr:hypothetical protein KLP28_00635 [Nocardioidaceae bacterium]